MKPDQAPLVSAEWLMQHRDECVLLDASIDRRAGPQGTEYASGLDRFLNEGHIPGAQFADLFGDFSDPCGAFAFTRPKAAGLQAALRRLGIDDCTRVVVYDALNGVWAARVWWLLQSAGLEHSAVLDGGLARWRAAGGELACGPAVAPEPGQVCVREIPGRLVDLAQVMATQAAGRPLVCALSSTSYAQDGHIPGSVNLAYADLLDDHGLLNLERLPAQLQSLALSSDDPLLLYCGGGVNACGLALALTAAGHDPDRLSVYDGSLNEWRADPQRPLATGTDRA